MDQILLDGTDNTQIQRFSIKIWDDLDSLERQTNQNTIERKIAYVYEPQIYPAHIIYQAEDTLALPSPEALQDEPGIDCGHKGINYVF